MVRDYLEAGRVPLAFGTLAFVILGITYLDAPLPPTKMLASFIGPFFLTLGIYSFNHVTDYLEDRVNKPNSLIVARRKTPNQLTAFAFVCKALAIAFAYLIGWGSFVLVCALVLVSFLYSWRFVGRLRLKGILVVKSLVVSCAVTSILAIPILAEGLSPPDGFIVLVAFVFLQNIMGTIISDMRDVEGDSKEDVITIPVAIGREWTMAFLLAVNIISLAVLVAGFSYWGLKQYLLLLPLICVWRYYTLGVMYENRVPVGEIYEKMDNPTYLAVGVLAVLGKLLGL